MEKIRKSKKTLVVISVLLAVLVLAAVFLLLFPPKAEAIKSTKQYSLSAGTKVSTVNSAVRDLSLSEMSESSTLIIYAKVKKINETILVKNAYGGISPFTDVEVEPVEVLRGEALDTVTIRLSGGLVGEEFVDYTAVPELFVNTNYLFFLYRPSAGGGVNTQGDYYYLNGMQQSVFKQPEPEEVNEPELDEAGEENKVLANIALLSSDKYDIADTAAYAVNKSGVVIDSLELLEDDGIASYQAVFTLNGLRDIYTEFNARYPVDENFYRREMLESYETNLKNGIITQDEYDLYKANIDVYAVIITEDEAASVDPEIESQKDELRRAEQEYSSEN